MGEYLTYLFSALYNYFKKQFLVLQLSGFRGSGWEWNEVREEYYYHMFAAQQPDLNYRSARVVETMKSVLRFWMDRGVAGYRVDAVQHLFETLPNLAGRYPDEPLSGTTDDTEDYSYLNHIYTQNQNETFDMVYEWREFLDQYTRDNGGDTRVMLTEAYEEFLRERSGTFRGTHSHELLHDNEPQQKLHRDGLEGHC